MRFMFMQQQLVLREITRQYMVSKKLGMKTIHLLILISKKKILVSSS